MEQDPKATPTPTDSALTILARQLAQNYLDTSLSAHFLPSSRKRRQAAEQVFEDEYLRSHEIEAPCRNILVVGAGVSSASFGKEAFPTTDLAVKKLNAALKQSVGPLPRWLRRKITAEKERLKLAYGFNDAFQDFETHLALLSRAYPPQAVANALSELYGERYWPHLTFEIIAHLLKHRFVDVVVNFNFDELLDQAIEEEIGRSQYHYVISDGQCRSVERVMVDNRLKVPIHIKPHGTASHASTLRFTKEHYFALPDGMRTLLENIVSGRTTSSGDEDAIRYRTNVISVGYGMKSIDFLKMLQATAKPDPRLPGPDHLAIYHVNTAEWYEGARGWLDTIGTDNQHLIDVREAGSLHGTLSTLWERIMGCFRPRFQPRGIARHQLVHALFFDEEGQRRIPEGGGPDRELKWERDADYSFARLCTELVIGIARGNGRVDLETMPDERVGIYFDRLREVGEEARKAAGKLEKAEDAASPDARAAAGRRLRELGARSYSIQTVAEAFAGCGKTLAFGGYESNILTAYFPQKTEAGMAMWLWEALQGVLATACGPELDAHMERLQEDPDKSKLLLKCFERLVSSDTYDISASFQHRHLLLASEPNPDEVLHTGLSLTLKFAEIIDLDWDLMLAVSEYGKILAKYTTHQEGSAPRRRRCSLIVADTDRNAETDARLRRNAEHLIGGTDEQPWYRLPYWAHNHHMLMVLKKGEARGRWRRMAGLSYEKSGLSNRVNPIFFHEDDRKDLERLENAFFGYVYEAENPGWWHLPLSGPDRHSTKSQLALTRGRKRAEELLKKWWDEID